MTAVWKRVVDMLLSILIPPLSDKESHAEPPSPQEVTVVFQWLKVRSCGRIIKRRAEYHPVYSFSNHSSMQLKTVKNTAYRRQLCRLGDTGISFLLDNTWTYPLHLSKKSVLPPSRVQGASPLLVASDLFFRQQTRALAEEDNPSRMTKSESQNCCCES